MSTNSNIEWTDCSRGQRFMLDKQYIDKRGVALGKSRINPFIWVFVPLCTVAGKTARNNVALDGLATPRYRPDMIPSVCCIGTISTSTAKHIEQKLLARNRYVVNASLAHDRMLASLRAIFRVICKANPFGCICAVSALSLMDIVQCDPTTTSPAPSKSQPSIQPSLGKRGSIKDPSGTALETDSKIAIETRAIATEQLDTHPLATLVTTTGSSASSAPPPGRQPTYRLN